MSDKAMKGDLRSDLKWVFGRENLKEESKLLDLDEFKNEEGMQREKEE